jgi:hypothetical protein
VFAAGFPRYLPLLPSVAAGFVSGALLIGLAAASGGPAAALLGAGIPLALLAVAYRFTAGYGITLAALGLAGTALVWDRSSAGNGSRSLAVAGSSIPLAAVALLGLAALFRVYYVRYDLDETSVFLTAHYTLIGLMTGSLAPLALRLPLADHASIGEDVANERRSRGGEWPFRLAMLAAVFLLPALMVIFWGIRACAGLLLGLALGQAFLLWVRLLEGEGDGVTARLARGAGAAPVLILAITCVQALFLFEEYSVFLTRTHRIALVLAIAAFFPLAILVRALAARRNSTRLPDV